MSPAGVETRRVVAVVEGRSPGPTLVAVAGLHGNEEAGLAAIQAVADLVDPHRLRGRLVGLAGNLPALAVGRRYLDRDLNRLWRPGRVERLRRVGPSASVREERQQRELLDELDRVFGTSDGGVVVDLHTTSGPGPPFTTFGDTLANRRLARAIPLPMVLGLEEQVAGTLLEYTDSLGWAGIAVEGGRHTDPRSRGHLTDALLLALGGAGMLPTDSPAVSAARARLAHEAAGLPPVVEMRYRYPVAPDASFHMLPGFTSFNPVEPGETVALVDGSPVRAREAGRILMPRYQPQGDDGFFIVRPVRPVWLAVSALLRRLRADRLAPLLPGVRRHRRLEGALVVDLRIARWFGPELFHLLGFRRRRRVGRALVLVRRGSGAGVD